MYGPWINASVLQIKKVRVDLAAISDTEAWQLLGWDFAAACFHWLAILAGWLGIGLRVSLGLANNLVLV
jgi:hypothetical protein